METPRGISRRVQKAPRVARAAAIPSGPGRRRRIATATASATLVVGATMALLAPISVADTPNSDGSSSKAPRTVQVSGQLVPQDAAGSTYELSGELIGTWKFPPVDIVYYQSDTRIFARGAESFAGCVNLNGDDDCDKSEPRGTWQGEYMYWASFDRNRRLVEGGCTHMLTGGTKAFRGVRGLFHMTDVYATTPAGSTAIYQGEVILNAVKEKPVPQTAAVGIAARPSSTGGVRAGC